jgi:hypothetical protein
MMGYRKQESATFNENFHKYIQEDNYHHQAMLNQNQLMPHQMQHHLQNQYPAYRGSSNLPMSPPATDIANNNFLSHETLQQRSQNLYGICGPRNVPYHQPHTGSYGSTIHYQGIGGLPGNGSSLAVAPSAGRTTGATSRGGSQVKIGRRPSHLPKVLKFQDGTLPPGWIRKLKCRKHGKQAGRWDVYIYSPCGVKFASRKKLKNFFEKNNLNYDPEDFDFTPYGRHSDHGVVARVGSGAGSSSGSGSSGGGRHNSSASTCSEGTHSGSSPASLHTYSPTLLGCTSSAPHLSHGMMPAGFGSAAADYAPFAAFDPRMENPPNANAADVQRMDAFGSRCSSTATGVTDIVVSFWRFYFTI